MTRFESRWTCYTVHLLDDDDNITDTVEVRTRDADIIATERQMGSGIDKLNALGSAELGPRIAWNGLRRMGRAVGDFDEFIARADVDTISKPPVLPDGLPDPNPSEAAPSSESESPSES